MLFDNLTTQEQKNLIIKLVEELQTGKYNNQFEGASDRGRWQIYLIGKEKKATKEIGNFRETEKLASNQKFLYFEELDLDKLEKEGYIFLDKRKQTLTGQLENKAYEEYKLYKKQQLSDVSNLEELREQLSEYQLKILTEIWNHYIENNEWIATRLLHGKFEKPNVFSAIEPLGGSIVCEVRHDTKERYMLTFLGILLTEEGKNLQDIVASYLEYVKTLFQKDPNIEEVSNAEIENALNLNKNQSKKLCHLIYSSHYNSGMVIGDDNWSANVPSDIDDLPYINNLSTHMMESAMKQYDPDMPISENDRFVYSSQKQKAISLSSVTPESQIKKSDKDQTGHTLYDLFIKMWRRYGPLFIVTCVLLFIGGWLFAHYLAEPGSQVSVWQLFAYTKKGDRPIIPKPVQTPSAPYVAGRPPPISSKGQGTSLQIYKKWENKHPEVLKGYGSPTICKFASIWGQFFEKGYIAYNVTHAWTVLFFRGKNEFRKLQNPGAHLTPGSGQQVDEAIFEEITSGMTDKERSFYRSLIDSRVKSPDFKGTGIIGGIGTLYVRERLYPAFGKPKENEYLTHDILIAKGSGYEVIAGLPHGLGGASDTSPKSIYVLYDGGRYERHVEFPIDTPKGFQ